MLTYFEAENFYNSFAIKQDTQAYYEDPAIDELIKFANFDQAMSLFEFGHGTGRLAKRLLAEQLPSTAHYHGVDLSPTMSQIASERLAEFGERAQIQVSNGSPRFDLPDHSVDRFLSTYVLDLLTVSDINAALVEAHRILRKNGKLCLVGLTYGQSRFAWLKSLGWALIHAIQPARVGGCRPLKMAAHLSSVQWKIEHQSIVTASNISSEVIVATAL